MLWCAISRSSVRRRAVFRWFERSHGSRLRRPGAKELTTEAPPEILDQPASGAARRAAALMDSVERQAEDAVVIFAQVEPLDAAGGDMARGEMQRHVAPAESRQQIFEPRGEVAEAPGARAGDGAV